MDRIRSFLWAQQPAFVPSDTDPIDTEENEALMGGQDEDEQLDEMAASVAEAPFSWIYYSIFLLLGVAMLWAWYVKYFDTYNC
jgi:hypothetical protein